MKATDVDVRVWGGPADGLTIKAGAPVGWIGADSKLVMDLEGPGLGLYVRTRDEYVPAFRCGGCQAAVMRCEPTLTRGCPFCGARR